MLTNREGHVLLDMPICDGMDLGDLDLRRANLRGLVASGLELSGSDLREADLSDSDLYWFDLYSADCSHACFRFAKLQGVNFKSACLRHADLSGATICADKLGRASSLAHADLSGAILDGADLRGTLYDSKTVWPKGFNPLDHGLLLTEVHEEWVVAPVCRDAPHE